jgi:hypothetical protein
MLSNELADGCARELLLAIPISLFRLDLAVSVGCQRTLRANQITVACFVKKPNLVTDRALRCGMTDEFKSEYGPS